MFRIATHDTSPQPFTAANRTSSRILERRDGQTVEKGEGTRARVISLN